MRIGVTGAAGFIGNAVATDLERDHDVIRYTRREWDITSGPIDGDADAVVHCAALADDWAPLATAMLVNRDGTRNVVDSFRGARFVHISSSSVYDAFVPTVNQAEAEPARRFLSTYSRSKAAAEHYVSDVILRPHAVYGPGDTTLLPRVLAGVRRGRLTLPGGGRVLHSLTHIDNLVQAVRLSLSGPPGIYNVGDAEPVLLCDAIARFTDAEIRSVPYRTAYVAAAIAERLPGRPRITRYAVSQLGLERTLDITKARELLGYRPA
ncbi:MAG: NAD(P)-dependent oxidoreductase [Actinomycetota bacterium]